MRHQISYCTESADVNPRREWVKMYDNIVRLQEAIKRAKRLCKLKHVFEVEIIAYNDDGDIEGHWYYRNSKKRIRII